MGFPHLHPVGSWKVEVLEAAVKVCFWQFLKVYFLPSFQVAAQGNLVAGSIWTSDKGTLILSKEFWAVIALDGSAEARALYTSQPFAVPAKFR